MQNKDYNGMTVNERLYESGLFNEFDNAYENGNIEKMKRILKEVSVDEDSIVEILKLPYKKYNSMI